MTKRLPVITSFVLFLALCASATYWTLQFMKPPQRAVAAVGTSIQSEIPLEVAAGLFGGRATKVAVATNFQLKGVVVAGNPRESIAIIGADGKPPQASRVNAEVVPGVRVSEVHSQYVLLTEGGAIKRVELQEAPKSAMQFASPIGSTSQSPLIPPRRSDGVPPGPPSLPAPSMPTMMVMPGPSSGDTSARPEAAPSAAGLQSGTAPSPSPQTGTGFTPAQVGSGTNLPPGSRNY